MFNFSNQIFYRICTDYDFFFNWQTEKKTILDQWEIWFLFRLLKPRKIWKFGEKDFVWWFDPMGSLQVNLFQKHLLLHQLTHNMTKDCSLNYKFSTWKLQAQNMSPQSMLCTQIIPCLSYCPAGIMVISVRSTRVKQFL